MTQLKITASYSRKTQPKNRSYEYEAEEAMLSVSFTEDVNLEEPGSPTAAELEQYARDRLKQVGDDVKGRVLSSLGIAYGFDEAGEIVEEVKATAQVAQAFPGVQVQSSGPGVAQQAEPFPAQTPQGYVPPPPGYQAPQAPAAPAAPAGGAQADRACPQCGGAMFNDTARNAQLRAGGFKLGSDFKCKNQQCGKRLWPSDYTQFKNNPQAPR